MPDLTIQSMLKDDEFRLWFTESMSSDYRLTDSADDATVRVIAVNDAAQYADIIADDIPTVAVMTSPELVFSDSLNHVMAIACAGGYSAQLIGSQYGIAKIRVIGVPAFDGLALETIKPAETLQTLLIAVGNAQARDALAKAATTSGWRVRQASLTLHDDSLTDTLIEADAVVADVSWVALAAMRARRPTAIYDESPRLPHIFSSWMIRSKAQMQPVLASLLDGSPHFRAFQDEVLQNHMVSGDGAGVALIRLLEAVAEEESRAAIGQALNAPLRPSPWMAHPTLYATHPVFSQDMTHVKAEIEAVQAEIAMLESEKDTQNLNTLIGAWIHRAYRQINDKRS